MPVAAGLGAHQPNRRLRLAAEPQTGRREVSALTDARKTLAYDFFRILRAPLNDRFVLPESQQKNLAELKRSFLDPALKQINEKTPLLAKYSIDDSGKFLFSIIDKQNPV
ncbi:TPA: replication initiation protein [Escherichia coli]